VSLGARKPPPQGSPEALPSLRGRRVVCEAPPSAVGAVLLRLWVGQDDGCGGDDNYIKAYLISIPSKTTTHRQWRLYIGINISPARWEDIH
jgi:hypothetical protein